jgi:anti-sigma-K factor RskA
MTAHDHDSLKDLIAPVALGAATAEETALVEAHAAECAVCREELAGFRMASSAVGLTVPQVDPPPALKARLMDEVRRDAALRRPATPSRVATRGRGSFAARLRARPWPALAAAAAVVVLVLVGWNVALQTGDDGGPNVRSVAVRGTAAAPGITGRALVISDEGTAVVRLDNLPAIRPDQEWELWAFVDGKPASRGFMTRTSGTSAIVATSDLDGVTALAVTPERPANVSAPTSDPRAVVPLPARG